MTTTWLSDVSPLVWRRVLSTAPHALCFDGDTLIMINAVGAQHMAHLSDLWRALSSSDADEMIADDRGLDAPALSTASDHAHVLYELKTHGQTRAARGPNGVTLWLSEDTVGRAVPGSLDAATLQLADDGLWVLRPLAARLERWALEAQFSRPHSITLSRRLDTNPLAAWLTVEGARTRLALITAAGLLIGAPRGLVEHNAPWPIADAQLTARDTTLFGLIARQQASEPTWSLWRCDIDHPDLPPDFIETPLRGAVHHFGATPQGLWAMTDHALWWLDDNGAALDMIALPCADAPHAMAVSPTHIAIADPQGVALLALPDSPPSSLLVELHPPGAKAWPQLRFQDHTAWRLPSGTTRWTTLDGVTLHPSWEDRQRAGAIVDRTIAAGQLWTLHEHGWLCTWSPQTRTLERRALVVPTPQRLLGHAKHNLLLVAGQDHVTWLSVTGTHASLACTGPPSTWQLQATSHGWLVGDAEHWYELLPDGDTVTLSMRRPRIEGDQVAHIAPGHLVVLREHTLWTWSVADRTAQAFHPLTDSAPALLAHDGRLAVGADVYDIHPTVQLRLRRHLPNATPLAFIDDLLILSGTGRVWACALPPATPSENATASGRITLSAPHHGICDLHGLDDAVITQLARLCGEASFRWPAPPDPMLMPTLTRAARALVAFDVLWRAPGIPRRDVAFSDSQRALAALGAAAFAPEDLRSLAPLLEAQTLARLARVMQ